MSVWSESLQPGEKDQTSQNTHLPTVAGKGALRQEPSAVCIWPPSLPSVHSNVVGCCFPYPSVRLGERMLIRSSGRFSLIPEVL